MKCKSFLFLCFFVLAAQQSYAQSTDSTAAQDQTPKKKAKNPQNVAANKAALMSAILPGLGQFHNRKYWKPPIIYIGAGVITYFIIDNNKQFQLFKDGYNQRIADPNAILDPSINGYSSDQLHTLRDQYHQYRDMSVVFGIALYALNILDAYIDRHLMEFDVNDDLSMHVKPFLYTANNHQFASGLTLNFSLRK
ncbi:MAG: hypothetical protein JWO58_584 [Chitinophagaceae bacterium]|nr:hypothetical protein [Chitinophagaceae bacterium]